MKVKKSHCFNFLFWVVLMTMSPVGAQLDFQQSGGDEPIAIEADETIEWLRDQKQYIARGNAEAVQGDIKVQGDELIADYDEDASGRTAVQLFTARNNVVLTTTDYKAFADKAVYDVNKDIITLTGQTVRIESLDGLSYLTAKGKIEFFGSENKAIATNRPQAVYKADGKERQEDQTIEADTMLGFFDKNLDGRLALSLVKAEGNVIVKTANETLRGKEGIYDIENGQAVVSGDVKITRGASQLNGVKATFDVKTGTSVLYSGETADPETKTGNQRVRGLFYLGDQ